MNSKTYWADREDEALKHYIQDEKEYDKRISEIYSDMLDGVQEQINAFYGKYAAQEGITIAAAKKRVSKLDIDAYERKAARYVKDKDFSKQANEEMRLYNLTMKVNRLEMLKANIGLELIKGHDELEKFMGEILQGRTVEELERQAGILGKTVRNNAKTAHSIVNASFHNATFSDRIWMYQDLLKQDLSKLLQTGLIQGKNPRVLAREIKKTFGVSRYNAERLMRTELARVQTDAQMKSFEQNGFDKFIFIVNSGCCDLCHDVANKDTDYSEKGVYLIKDMRPGENAPPVHPHCRCSTAAWEDSEEYNAWLDYLAKGGTTEEWNKQQSTKNQQNDKLSNAGISDKIKAGSSTDYFDRKARLYEANEDLKAVNPNFKTKEYQWTHNCQRCVPAYEMRRRGFRVTAKPIPTTMDKDYLAQNYAAAWENQDRVWCMRGSGLRQIKEQMAVWGDGARAEVYIAFDGSMYNGGGHVFVAEQRNGKTIFIDPQSGDTDCSRYFEDAAKGKTNILRIDNNEPSNAIIDCCNNGGG